MEDKPTKILRRKTMKRSIEYRFEQKIKHGELKKVILYSERGEEILYQKNNYRERDYRKERRN